MPIGMPTRMPELAIQFPSVPGSGNACQLVHPGATAAIVFKTAAFDHSATPPERETPINIGLSARWVTLAD